jgi:serine protease SohB
MSYFFNFVFILAFVLFILAIVALVFIMTRKNGGSKKGRINITNLNKKFAVLGENLNDQFNLDLDDNSKPKSKSKEEVEFNRPTKKLFVINFNGDVQANKVENLREEVTAILQVTKPGDEVLVKLESPGGVVHGYGLAASQLIRLKTKGLKLTVAVDKVAASGGYMMASVADHIVAAPFAVLGSIGVVIEFPNFSNLLDKVGVKYLQLTAGEHKRTVSAFVANSDEGIQKTKEELTKTHKLFKDHISKFRPNLKMDEVATGETWYGSDALNNGLIDEVQVSDDLILDRTKDFSTYLVEYKPAKKTSDILSDFTAETSLKVINYFLEKIYANSKLNQR